MAEDEKRTARIHRQPPVEIYEVSKDQLDRIEESSRNVGVDFSFSIASLSICSSFMISIFSSNPTGTVLTVYIVVATGTFIAAAYTGLRWFFARRRGSRIFQEIRDLKMDPDSYWKSR